MSDVHDIAGLEAQLDPDGSLAAVFDAGVQAVEHEWVLSALLSLTPPVLRDLEVGRRRSFSFTLPSGEVRFAVFCERCQLTWDQMSEQERERCRA